MKTITTVLTALALTLAISCNEKKDKKTTTTTPTPDPVSPTALTTAEMIGTWNSPCVTTAGMGSAFNGTSYYTQIEIRANEEIHIKTRIYTGSTCYSYGGVQLLEYLFFGDITAGSVSATITGATEIEVDNLSQYLTIKTGATSASWKTLLDGACASTFSVDSSLNMMGKTCTDATITTQTFGYLNTIYKNVLKISGTTLSVYRPTLIYKIGEATYPTSTNTDYTKF